MKYRESGMPPRDYWESLLDVALVLDRFNLGSRTGDVAELGCGYGTFTVPLARRIRGTSFVVGRRLSGFAMARRFRLLESSRRSSPTQREDFNGGEHTARSRAFCALAYR